jgi:indolepyruvate ferredoxin oxidoreductase beta subunit
LCPSFYRADIVRNPNVWDRFLFRLRGAFLDWFGGTTLASNPSFLLRDKRDESPQKPRSPSHQPSSQGTEGVSQRRQEEPRPISGSNQRPLTLLIAALGGEGGGVLTNWIVSAAESLGFPVQSTSIPGVAQRTGATTYYIEILPVRLRGPGARKPVLALNPGIGDIDVLVASELMEAGRAVAAGFVTPKRTLAIASSSRFYVINEKIAMGDGRYSDERLTKAIEQHARETILIDLVEIARKSGAMVNAVMLGAIAGSGRLPIPVEAFENAIRVDGKAVDANLRGFLAGLDAAREAIVPVMADLSKSEREHAPLLPGLERETERMPEEARGILREGLRRLAAYQDVAYARLYFDRLAPVLEADTRAKAEGRLLRETARHLAVRMSYEDVIRVAQAKIDPTRFARIADEIGVKPGEPFAITEFLKPGIEEMCSILPHGLAKRILALAERRGWLGRLHWGMEINSVSISGYLRFWVLAKMRRWRPRSHRYRHEQRAIEAWLALIVEAAALSPELALEIAECARLIKGYGDTVARGSRNYHEIERHVMRPALAGDMTLRQAIDAIGSARTAALVDPEGESLARCLGDIETQSVRRIAAE